MGLRCHYEVLAVERDAAAQDVKKAFHRQALKWHPDKHQKNGISPEEATQRFQEIQNAYEVLSDPHERKWYDDHRDQILRGEDDENGDAGSAHELNLFKFFSASVYSGFGDDDKSFYAVYGALFVKVDEMDSESAGTSATAPAFGNGATPMDSVSDFYRHWSSYISQRSFSWVDEYKTTDAPTRQIRRAMEKENKKLRDVAKKAFTNDVRELVEFVRKRDPRMLAFQRQREKEREEQQRAEEQRKKDKQAAYEAQRLAFQQQEHERWEDAEQATSRLADDHIQEELDRLRKKMDADVLACEICNKTFKSDKQLQNHLTSKKHKDREIELGIVSEFDDDVEDALEREMLEELAALKKQQQQQPAETAAAAVEGLSFGEAKEEGEEDTAALEAQREKERVRLEKELKAAEKRKERKDARKTKKKEEVDKIVTAAKSKQEDLSDDEGRGKRGKGKKKR